MRGAYAAAGAQALSASVTDGELTKDNVSIALVGAGTPLTLLEDAELEPHLAALRDEPRAGALPVPCWGCQVRGCRDKLALRRLHSFSRDAGPAGTEAVFQGAAPRGRCAASGPACKLAAWLFQDQRNHTGPFSRARGHAGPGAWRAARPQAAWAATAARTRASLYKTMSWTMCHAGACCGPLLCRLHRGVTARAA